MTVVLNEPGIEALFTNPVGPVGSMLALRADLVAEKAYERASGPIINFRTQDLRRGIKAAILTGVDGLYAKIGTDAEHREFPYPSFLETELGLNWLTGALEEVFS